MWVLDFRQERSHESGYFESKFIKAGHRGTKEGLRIEEATSLPKE